MELLISKSVLFQRPTRLADGLGLEELPLLSNRMHPKSWFPRSAFGGLGLIELIIPNQGFPWALEQPH